MQTFPTIGFIHNWRKQIILVHVYHPTCNPNMHNLLGNSGSCNPMYSPISLGDVEEYANFVGFRGLVPLLPHFCQLSVPEVGVCGVYSESP